MNGFVDGKVKLTPHQINFVIALGGGGEAGWYIHYRPIPLFGVV